MKVKYIVYVLLIVGLGALIVYRISSNSKMGNTGPTGPNIAKVSGMILKPRAIKENIVLAGTLEANEEIDIRSEVSGVVESINFQEGTKVSKGQLLLRVNDIELRAQLSMVQTAKKLASENERRAKLLLEKQAISQEEYDIASADFQSASAEAELIEAQLSKTSIKAPFAGTIGLRSISTGTYVTPSTIIAKLVNTDALKVTFSVPEKYASRIKVGTVLSFTTSDSGEEYPATIYAIDPQVDIVTRTLRMRAIMDNRDNKLYPGAYTSIQLPLETINGALMVPSEALIPIQNGKRIFVLENGRAKELDVEIGTRTGNEVHVLTNLHPGDTVLTYGVMSLQDGSPVEVTLIGDEPLTQTQ